MDSSSEASPRHILVVVGASLSTFCSVGFLNAFGIFQEYYGRTFLRDKSEFDIAWIGSFAAFGIFGFAAPAGFLTDKLGPRIPILFGGACTIVAVFMISLCTEYYQFFLAQGLLISFGNSFLVIAPTTTITRVFVKNRGLASGIAIAGSSLGGLIWPIMMNQLLNHDGVSFGWTLRVVGFMETGILAVIYACFIKPPTAPPDTEGASSTGGKEQTEQVKTEQTEEKQKPKKDFSSLTKPAYIFFCCGLAVGYFGMFVPFFFVSTYAVSLGMSSSLGFYLVSIVNAASLVGRILPGFIADRYGHFNILFMSMLFAGIICMCWTAAESAAGVIVWVLAYGFASGNMMASQLACASDITPTEIHGAAIGVALCSVSLTGLFGTPIAGQLINYGYVALSMWGGATLLAGAAFILLSRLQVNKNVLAKA
ncbi:major facilitator superfamily domain-containing protein [Lineolata rhizophorae]|uniref:Major facilitator superfamily domain-containing protein n=1 Tax=Lineolata rhizophorae TaxID=578093 RepID=A0A6A6P3S2_9PEZI|nr:major facilitator superfamily domain-containing protein [Lineolata rhizophorae]